MLGHTRLLTVTGAGGVGKTRTALAVGHALVGDVEAGVWLVELAPVARGTFVANALARALFVEESPNRPLLETLLAYLKPQAMVLISDNCEHIIAEVAALADALLRACPKLRILATSREPLRIAGEQLYRLPSLPVPAATASAGLTGAEATNYEAIMLFAQRARANDHRFALADDTAPIVAEICRRLDGIPLAIELAARRVDILPVLALSQVLDERFRILTRGDRTALPRHQTMRAVIDWSYELLGEDERALLRRISVFVNGFKPGGAVAVSGNLDDLEVFDVLASLIDKSMVAAESTAGALRCRLLESTRIYALEKLQAAHEHRDTIGRRLRYLRDSFCELRRRVDGSGCSRELDELLAAELEDVRSSLDCGEERCDRKASAELLAAIDNRWTWIGLTIEGAMRLKRVIALMPTDEPGLASRLWTALARTVTANSVQARECSSIAVDLARKAGDPATLAEALTMHADAFARPGVPAPNDALAALAEAESLLPRGNLWLQLRIRRVSANAMQFLGNLGAAAQAYETLRETHRQLGNVDEANNLAVVLAETQHENNQTEKAVALVQEVLPALETSRFRSRRRDALRNLCGYLIALDRPWDAWLTLKEALPAIFERDGHEDILEAIVHAALIVALKGDVRRGAQLAGFIDSPLTLADFTPTPTQASTRTRLEALLQRQLAPDELRALRAAGSTLSVEDAVALVRASLDD